MSLYDTKPPRVHAWMAGYYSALQEQNKALIDIPFESLSHSYRLELSKRALRETQHLVMKHKNHKKIDTV
jgi:hypothetical protein